MLHIAISGVTGRMGQALVRLIDAADDVELAGGIGAAARSGEAARRYGCDAIADMQGAADTVARADVLIDFSAPAALGELLDRHGDVLAGRALVIGTTGLDAQLEAAIAAAAQRSPILAAANFSIGVHVLARLVEQAVHLLGDDYDIEIVEAHHRGKRDAPSGTALMLGAAAAKARGTRLEEVRRDGRGGAADARPRDEIGMHAVRGGGVVGEHRVLLLGEREALELRHEALDRSLFAAGALHAARWLATRGAGRYTMADLIG